MADRVLVAPPGITRPDQFAERNTQRMSQPMMGPRSSLVVGGPAYFTPEGYQAPIQPTQSFMPTNRAPDPIRDQFNRQLPPIQRPQPPMPAPQPQMPAPTPAPVQAPAPTQTGGVGDPAPYVPPYVPPEPVTEPVMPPPLPEGYEYDQDGNIVLINEPTPEPVFTPPPTMPEPNGFFPGVTPDFSNLDFSGLSDLNLEDMDFSNLPVPPPPPPPRIPVIEDMDFTNMPDFSNVPGIQNIDFSGLPQYQMPAPPPALASVQTQGIPIGEMPVPPEVLARKKRQEEERKAESIRNAIAKYGSVENQQKSIREALATPAPIYTPPPQIEEMFDDYDFGNPNLRNMRGFDPRR